MNKIKQNNKMKIISNKDKRRKEKGEERKNLKNILHNFIKKKGY